MSSSIPPVRTTVLFSILIGIMVMVGCSTGGSVTTPEMLQPIGSIDSNHGRVIWTAFDFVIDPEKLDVKIIYPREGDKHWNVTGFLLPPACPDCVKLHVIGVDPVEKIYSISVTFKNPTVLTGYDVRGIILLDPGDTRELVNAEDYTKIFDDDILADMNPFKVFGKLTNKRSFSSAEIPIELYEIRFPDPPDFAVSYVVDASWPGNQLEPYEIIDKNIDGNLDAIGLETRTVSCVVRDWQNYVEYVKLDLSTLGFPEEITFNHGAGDYYYTDISNDYDAPAGEYECLISAKAEDSDWLLYDYITIVVDEWPQGPPIWVDTIGITGTEPGNGYVTVTYGVAVDPDEPVHYNIYWDDTTPVDFGTADKVEDFDGSPHKVDGLTNGQTYYFAVRAEDDLGFEDANTNELPGTPFINPVEEWTVQTTGVFNSSPVFVDLNDDGTDDVVIGSEDDNNNVYALDGIDGTELWTFPTGNWVDSSPAVAYETSGGINIDIVIGSYDGNVYRIDGETGVEVWSFPTGDLVHASPALADLNDDEIMDAVVGSYDGKLYAINGADGTELWNYDIGEPIYSSAALGDINDDGVPDAFVGAKDNNLHAVDGATGVGLWTFPTGDWINGSPALYDFSGDSVLDVVFTSLDGYLYVVNGDTQAEIISYETGDKCWTSPALGFIDHDLVPDIVFGSDDYTLYCISGANASEIWTFASGDRIWSSAALVELTGDNVVDALVGSNDGDLYLIDGATGNAVWQVHTSNWIDSSPCVGDPDHDDITEVAVGGFDGKVYLYSADIAYPTSNLIPWPKFRRNWEMNGLFN